MLPQHRDENKYGGDEDDRQRNLRDESRRERLDLTFGAIGIVFLVPTREGGEQEQTDEGEDDSNNTSGTS